MQRGMYAGEWGRLGRDISHFLYCHSYTGSCANSVSCQKVLNKSHYFLARLEGMAHDIEGDYIKFDDWRKHCDVMNQGLVHSEKLIKNEEKIGNDIDTVENQLDNNEVNGICNLVFALLNQHKTVKTTSALPFVKF